MIASLLPETDHAMSKTGGFVEAVHKKIAREKVKLRRDLTKAAYNDQASLRGMKFVEELHQARESGSRARRLASRDHCIVIVTPPTAAEASSPTFGPLSCKITPLAFCNCTPPAPAAIAPPAPPAA